MKPQILSGSAVFVFPSCCLWSHGCSGRRRARPLCVPVGGGPPARRPRCEPAARSGRSRGPPWPCRRPPAPRPGPVPRSVPYPQFRMQFPDTCSSSLSEKPGISTIVFQSMKCARGNCMRLLLGWLPVSLSGPFSSCGHRSQSPPPPTGTAASPCGPSCGCFVVGSGGFASCEAL